MIRVCDLKKIQAKLLSTEFANALEQTHETHINVP